VLRTADVDEGVNVGDVSSMVIPSSTSNRLASPCVDLPIEGAAKQS
jgi:hypothetical protein